MEKKKFKLGLVPKLIIAIIIGILFGQFLPTGFCRFVVTLSGFFSTYLKFIIPLMILAYVTMGIADLSQGAGQLLLITVALAYGSTLLAGTASCLFPQTLSLGKAAKADVVPQGLSEVIQTLLTNIVANPIQAIIDGNYICILMWACLFGLAMKSIANESSKAFMANVADAVSQVIRWVINLAPFGIMGLVFTNVADNGLSAFTKYGSLLLLLVGTMLLMVLVFGPLVIFIFLRRNPYPLVYRCFKESGLTAFFTRSSAANIPVNMQLCEKLGLDKDMYSVSIPLGATINMNGAAITITIMAMAAANTLGIQISLPAAILLSVVSALGACGASGVAGGSLLLIPMACSLFGISNDIAMQVVGVGFIIGVIQDSVETCLNSASDVEFAATAEYHAWLKQGRQLPAFMYSKKERAKLGIEA